MSNWLEKIFFLNLKLYCWELFENFLGHMALKWTCLPGPLGIYIIFTEVTYCVFILWAYSSTFETTIIILFLKSMLSALYNFVRYCKIRNQSYWLTTLIITFSLTFTNCNCIPNFSSLVYWNNLSILLIW